ncbi:MAG: hypothetical protein N3E51_00275 [Candidatus Micrarchaeota archaeon]|nr:hypothetical protein [Candidatus Micrarchaeota archaeon]
MGKQAFLVVKHIASCGGTLSTKPYLFYLSSEKPPLGRVGGTCATFIVASKKVPRAYGAFWNKLLEGKKEAELGSIVWDIAGNRAISIWYFPKKNAEMVGGFGYYLDILSCNHLAKEYKVSYVQTTRFPTKERIAQLERVGIPIREPVEMRKYLEGLAKAVRFKMQAAGKQQDG